MMKNLRCSAKLPRPKNAKSSDRREQPEEHIGDKTVRLVTNNNNSELQSLLNAKPDYQEDHPPSSAMKYLLLGDSLAHPTENPSKRHTSESDYSSKSDYLSHKPQIRKQTNRSVNGVRKIIFWPNLQNAVKMSMLIKLYHEMILDTNTPAFLYGHNSRIRGIRMQTGKFRLLQLRRANAN
jgi:hypothetical protein